MAVVAIVYHNWDDCEIGKLPCCARRALAAVHPH